MRHVVFALVLVIALPLAAAGQGISQPQAGGTLGIGPISASEGSDAEKLEWALRRLDDLELELRTLASRGRGLEFYRLSELPIGFEWMNGLVEARGKLLDLEVEHPDFDFSQLPGGVYPIALVGRACDALGRCRSYLCLLNAPPCMPGASGRQLFSAAGLGRNWGSAEMITLAAFTPDEASEPMPIGMSHLDDPVYRVITVEEFDAIHGIESYSIERRSVDGKLTRAIVVRFSETGADGRMYMRADPINASTGRRNFGGGGLEIILVPND